MKRVYNFSAGPATLPEEVLKKASEAILEYDNLGFSLIEMSHRSKPYDKINEEAEADMKKIMGLGDDYQVLFMGGGASLQFSMVPMNFLKEGMTADYINTGVWAGKAVIEAKKEGNINVIASSEDRKFCYVPKDIKCTEGAAFLHYTTNNTIYGTEYQFIPDVKVPLVADMSSDMLSRKMDFSKYSLIYAGAQKNLGPAGATIIVVKKSFLETAKDEKELPVMLSYKAHAAKKSIYNTPPVFPIFTVGLVLKWILAQGGLEEIEKANIKKSDYLYKYLDENTDFYSPTVDKDSRSRMNVTFRLVNHDLEPKFIEEAKEVGLVGMKGHRSTGGLRTSIYNAFPYEGVVKLVEFMEDFKKNNK